MKLINIHDQHAAEQFAREAAEHFADNPKHYVFSREEPAAGAMLAVRWNRATVLVCKLDDGVEPTLYSVGQFGIELLPPLKPTDAT